MDRIEKLEQYRELAGMSKADMARYFDVIPQNYSNWVRRNSLPKEQFTKADQLLSSTRENGQPLQVAQAGIQYTTTRIPILNWEQAPDWDIALEEIYNNKLLTVMPTSAPHSNLTFALRVETASMTLPPGIVGHSFPHGMIIYVDPVKIAENENYVIATNRERSYTTFRKLQREEGNLVLVPLNPDRSQYPIIKEGFDIIGCVIDASWGGF